MSFVNVSACLSVKFSIVGDTRFDFPLNMYGLAWFLPPTIFGLLSFSSYRSRQQLAKYEAYYYFRLKMALALGILFVVLMTLGYEFSTAWTSPEPNKIMKKIVGTSLPLQKPQQVQGNTTAVIGVMWSMFLTYWLWRIQDKIVDMKGKNLSGPLSESLQAPQIAYAILQPLYSYFGHWSSNRLNDPFMEKSLGQPTK